MPSGSGYSPHLRVRPGQMLGVYFIGVPEDAEPGQPFNLNLGLLYHPDVDYSDLKPSASFEVLEGAKVIGTGTVNEGPHLIALVRTFRAHE